MTEADVTLPSRRDYAVLWDVDGVIIDSGEQHRQSWRELARENGLAYSDERFWASFGRRNADVIPYLFGISPPVDDLARLADRKEEIYRELLSQEAIALPGAKELLAELHAAGYHQVLGSSAPRKNIELVVKLLGIAPSLDGAVSGEDVARGKPAPDIYVAAAAKAGVITAHCLVIEDAVAGIEAAHAAGMAAIAVRRAGLADPPGLQQADFIATSLSEVDVARVDHLLRLI
jgi:beta-phosphoglucomutase